MLKYLVTTFSILWFCESPKEPIHFAILAGIISFIATHYSQNYYYINTEELEEPEKTEGNNENDD